jgi:hypothetical protein
MNWYRAISMLLFDDGRRVRKYVVKAAHRAADRSNIQDDGLTHNPIIRSPRENAQAAQSRN